MKKTISLILVFAALILSGCTTNYKGLIPEKDVHMKNVRINSPWTGLPIFSADEIDTRVNKAGGVTEEKTK